MNGEADLVRWFLVDGRDLSRAADEHGGSDIGSGLSCLVGEVGAFRLSGVGGGEVEGVGVAAAAEGDVGPFPVGVPVMTVKVRSVVMPWALWAVSA